MSRILEWGDGEYEFALPGKCVEELQKVTGHGLLNIATRLQSQGGDWKLEEVRHVIRLGLIGGGMGAVEASRLVNMYVGQDKIKIPLVGPNSATLLAGVILNDVLFGFTEIPQKKTVTKKKTPKGS